MTLIYDVLSDNTVTGCLVLMDLWIHVIPTGFSVLPYFIASHTLNASLIYKQSRAVKQKSFKDMKAYV